MLGKDTITLLRIPFSFFLMPVFFLSLSQIPEVDPTRALLVFLIIHVLMYPASNGYNSYMDQDEGSIGLLEKPPRGGRELYVLTFILDGLAIALSTLVNTTFAVCVVCNVLASRAYSFRGIRLKKYPVWGFLTVIVFQGAITFLMVYKGAAADAASLPVPWTGMLVSSLLFGGFYPLTQVYQHEQDIRDGVETISYRLGVTGTFVFSGMMYLLAEIGLFILFFQQGKLFQFWLLQLFFIPVVWYFVYWWRRVLANPHEASFQHSMRMNMVAALSTNAAFILLYLMNHSYFE